MRKTTLLLSLSFMVFSAGLNAQGTSFHNAPATAAVEKNPYDGQASAISAGKASYAKHCAACHGASGEGTGNVPPLAHGALQGVPDGAIFWYITHGGLENGMPSWAALPTEERWQLVTCIKSMSAAGATAAGPAATVAADRVISNAPPPEPPFTDYRFEKPGTIRHISLADLPQPYATKSATGGPTIVGRPENAWPKAPEGFTVGLYATGLTNPRILRRAPNGDIFLAETSAGDIKVFRGMTTDGKPREVHVFATGLNIPFGIAFYPLGPNPQWVYSQHEFGGSLSVSQRRSGSQRPAPASRRSAQWRPPPFQRRPILPRRQDHVRLCGLAGECRRLPRGEKSGRHSGVQSRRFQQTCLCLWHSQSGRYRDESENRRACGAP